MKINRNLAALVMVVGGVTAWLALKGDDPVNAARMKCEFSIESLTGYDLSLGEVATMDVAGDVYNGTVQGTFARSGTRRTGVCIFKNGKIARVMVDGRVLAGR